MRNVLRLEASSPRGPQMLELCALEGSVTLAGTSPDGPVDCTRWFARSGEAALMVPEGFRGTARIRLVGFMAPGPSVDLTAAWELHHVDGELRVVHDPGAGRGHVYGTVTGRYSLEVSAAARPGVIGLTLVPIYQDGIDGLGDCQLAPIEYEVTLRVQAEERIPEVPPLLRQTDVLFEVDSARLVSNQRLALFRELFERFSAPPIDIRRRVQSGQYRITVEGHASSSGDESRNRKLARARAAHVRDALAEALGLGDLVEVLGAVTCGHGDDDVEAPGWRIARIRVIRRVRATP